MMDANEPVVVYTVSEPGQAEIVKLALEAEGIRCSIGGENQAGLTGALEITVSVRAADADRARELLESHNV